MRSDAFLCVFVLARTSRISRSNSYSKFQGHAVNSTSVVTGNAQVLMSRDRSFAEEIIKHGTQRKRAISAVHCLVLSQSTRDRQTDRQNPKTAPA